MPRLFSGLELPEDIRDRLADISVPLPGASWVDIDDMHITLRFIGDVDRRTAEEFADQLAAIELPAFSLRISGLGVFGGKQPRTLWAGLDPSPELDALARAHDQAARAVGIPPAKRGFKPHITLARLRNVRPDEIAGLLNGSALLVSSPFLIEQCVLFSARPQVGGGPYVVEEVFPLAGTNAVEFDPADNW